MLFSVMLGGALGALSRYLINVVMQHPSFPFVTEKLSYATFTVNILGSFFLAFIVFGFGDNWRPELKLAITTGFLGSFTTFSTFEVETLQLIEKGNLFVALSYVVLSVVAGFMAAVFGRWCALQTN